MITSSGEALIEIDNLTWGYPKSPSLLFSDFHFTLKDSDFCFILGTSGVGKTTLVKFLTRQLRPPKKRIFFRKEDIARLTNREVQKYRRKIGVIFQDYKLIDRRTVRQNIAFPLELIGVNKERINKSVDELLEKLSLLGQQDTPIPHLSGGEKQRVAIARSLIVHPEFLIADEPTGNLDFESSKGIADILIDLNRQGNTILCITHNLSIIEYVQAKHKVRIVSMSK